MQNIGHLKRKRCDGCEARALSVASLSEKKKGTKRKGGKKTDVVFDACRLLVGLWS